MTVTLTKEEIDFLKQLSARRRARAHYQRRKVSQWRLALAESRVRQRPSGQLGHRGLCDHGFRPEGFGGSEGLRAWVVLVEHRFPK
jgi:hypothetical protein